MLATLEAPTPEVEVEPDEELTGRNYAYRSGGRFFVSPEVFRAINTVGNDDLNDLLDDIPVYDFDDAQAMNEIRTELCLN